MPRLLSLTSVRIRSDAPSWHVRAAVAFLAVLIGTFSASASADLYRWTDERGTTVLSNVLPANPKRVTNFEVVVKEPDSTASKAYTARQHEVTWTEKLLLDRIDGLERQIQTQQSARETAIVAAPPSDAYYGPAAPYADGYGYPGYYPSWVFPYPPGYFWGYPPTTSVVIGSRFGARGGVGRTFTAGHSATRIVTYPPSFSSAAPLNQVIIGGVRR
jgi:hypothetical protein